MAAAAAAAAAASSSSRATKGLFLTFTLLSLICSARSHIDKKELDQIKETLEKAQKQSDRLKEYLGDMPDFSALLDDSTDMLDQLMTYMKKTSSFDDDFPPVGRYLESLKGFIKNTKAYVDRTTEKLGGKMQENENKLEKMKKLVKFFEENQAEL